MDSMKYRNVLIKLVKELGNEDIVWILHVINKEKIIYDLKLRILDNDDLELIEMDIDKLNSSKNLNELKNNRPLAKIIF